MRALRSARLIAVVLFVLALVAVHHAGAQSPAPGKASGSFSIDAKTVNITYAAAFVDQNDKEKPIILVLSDQAMPAEKWTSASDLGDQRREHPFNGVAFWLDQKRSVFRTDYYEAGEFPTSTSGIFDLKLDASSGKSLVGSATSTSAAAKLSKPVKLDVTFMATLK